MDVWGWIVAYAVGLTILQLLVYRYLLSNGGSLTRRVGTPFGDTEGEASLTNGSSSSNRPSRSNRSSSQSSDTSAEHGSPPSPAVGAWPRDDGRVNQGLNRGDTAQSRRCPHCGAENEPDTTFRLCWNCARGL